LSSMNKKAIADIFDSRDIYWTTLVEGRYFMNADWNFGLNATHFHALHGPSRNSGIDSTHYILGADAQYSLSDRVSVGLGVEQTVENKDYSEARVLGNLSYHF